MSVFFIPKILYLSDKTTKSNVKCLIKQNLGIFQIPFKNKIIQNVVENSWIFSPYDKRKDISGKTGRREGITQRDGVEKEVGR